jgi:hypothetical protein
VEISHPDSFSEQLPLVMPEGTREQVEKSRFRMRRSDGSAFVVDVRSSGATLTLGERQNLGEGLSRRMLTIHASGALRYELHFD